MANLNDGAVLGGRYLITSHLMTSGDQDTVLAGLDRVLNRDVKILVAAPQNAAQVATSARELATGERQSSVQILDLGLSDDRTYLVAADTSEIEDLMALVSAHQVYVEPFHTETLGSEIFGESRSYEPETYDDDAEYYSELDEDLVASEDEAQNRPNFLNRISDRLNERFSPGAAGTAGTAGAAAAADSATSPTDPQIDHADTATEATQQVAPRTEPPVEKQPVAVQQHEPEDDDPRDIRQRVAAAVGTSSAAAGTTPPPTDDGYVYEDEEPESGSNVGRWIGALVLAAILIAAVVVAFNFLGSDDPKGPAESPVAEESPSETQASTEPKESESPKEDKLPEPVISHVTRQEPDGSNLMANSDGDLQLLTDGNNATTWNTLSFTSPQFGGFIQNMALIFELEEESAVSEILIEQQSGTGGAFEVMVSDEADPAAGTVVSEGSFTSPTYTATVPATDGEPTTARYVIVNFTELPTLSNPNSAERPYGMRLAEVEIK